VFFIKMAACFRLLLSVALLNAVAALPSLSPEKPATRAPAISALNPIAAPIEGGTIFSVQLEHPLSPSDVGANLTCNFQWSMESWELHPPAFQGTLAADGKTVRCAAMPPLPGEGPIGFFLQVSGMPDPNLTIAHYNFIKHKLKSLRRRTS